MEAAGREGKYLLKKSLEPLLPNEVLYRSKMGFWRATGQMVQGSLKSRLRRDLLESGLADTGLSITITSRVRWTSTNPGGVIIALRCGPSLMFQATIRDDAFALEGLR